MSGTISGHEPAAINWRTMLGHDFWIFHVPKLPRYGFWSMMHEARADFDMLLGSLYLLIEGAGAWSLDAMLARKRRTITSAGGLRP
ncbi:MAG: hypothetical protein ACLQJR_01175 [Stellaceae bacterium]